jgi:hypothetical protein
MVNSVSGNYNDWITSLNSRGIKTTSLGKNEANFADYTNALSESLKQEIMASFDCDADYDLQAKLASLYSSNVEQSGNIVSAAKQAGIQVSVQYVNTSYIVDNKKGGQYANNKSATNGSIAVYTFKDANGGEIKIADANGNGALETEELFMNELLSGVVSDISAPSGSGVSNKQVNVQNTLQNTIQDFIDKMQEQLEESQKHFEEIAQALKQGSTDSLKTGNKDENSKTKIAKSNSKNADKNEEIKDEAEDIIKKKYPELTKTQIDEYLDDIADKVSNTGISVERAVKAVMGDLEQAA